MTCDVISLCASGTTVLPFASETEIIGTFPADVIIAKMIVESFRVDE